MDIRTQLRIARLIFVFVFFLAASAVAQKIDMEKLKGMEPRAIGPAGMSGRVTAIDVVNDKPDVIYVGTASGGLWKSTSGGIRWKPIFEKEAVASIGAIAIQQSNPDVIWAGTGEGNPRNSVTGGYGVYKSLDGGKNWRLMGLEKTRNIHRIVVNKDNPDVVFVAAIGSSWGEQTERGVYKTEDGGETWEKILYVDNKTGCADLVADPVNPNKLLATMWEHRRKPWTFSSGGPGSGLYMTVDGGKTWEKRTEKDGLPKGDLGRIGVAIAKSKPNVVYALIEAEKNGLYKSEDGGYKWNKVSEKKGIGNRPFYYSEIYVDPHNENRLYSLFTYVNVSEDGGKSFKQLMPAYNTTSGVHPDHHAWWIHPQDPSFMMDGNDGGLNITHDGGKNWRFVENLPIAQFYHINVDMEFPYNVYGGMQDNGSWAGPAYVWKSQGIRNAYWQEILFGDGFDVVPDPDDSRYGYAMSQQGFVARYDRQTGYSKIVRPVHPDMDIKLRFNWNSAIAQDPFNNNTIYFGSQFVHKSVDKGNTWEVISPDLTTNNPKQQEQHLSGGLTMDATGAENYNTVLAIAPSPVQKEVIWVGTDDGKVHLTKNGGERWEDLSEKLVGIPEGSWIPQIKPSTFNAGEAYVIVNNYRRNDFKPYLLKTTDFGNTWEQILSENKVWGYTLSFVQDLVEPKLLFLGTEYGLYVSIDEGKEWTKWTNGYPTVSTMDLAIQPREHDLVIGTFGRAAYVLDDIRPLRDMAKNGTSVLKSILHTFPVPDAYITLNQEPSGTRFGGDAIFNGQNRKKGAMISYSFTKPEENKKELEGQENKNAKRSKKKAKSLEVSDSLMAKKTKYDSIKAEIFNADGGLIRTLKVKTPDENGLHRMYWKLDEAGVRDPSRKKTKSRGREPRGQSVLPGKYKIRLSFGEMMDSTEVTVKFDPRIEVSATALSAKYDLLKKLKGYKETAVDAMDRLRTSLEILDQYNKKLKQKESEIKDVDKIKGYSKQVKDSINHIMDLIVGKDSKKQGITMDPKPSAMDFVNNASWYIRSSIELPGATQKLLVRQATEKMEEVVLKVNKFYAEAWKTYRSKVENIPLSPFNEYDNLKIDKH